MSRIALTNRPSLEIDIEFIDAIAADLAADGSKRKRFIDDPAAYLNMRDLPVSNCRLVSADVSMASEVCTANAICNVNALVNVNAFTKVNAATAVNLVSLANVANAVNATNAVNTYSAGPVLYTQESIKFPSSFASFEGYGVL